MPRVHISHKSWKRFTSALFADDHEGEQVADILPAILAARSPRLTDIAQAMAGSPGANYKRLQRFLAKTEAKEALNRLFWEEAPFVIGDPTEVERPEAKKTAYVGRLSDGKTLGFWLLVLAVPYQGRALPFHCITYSARTISEGATSRNWEHRRALAEVKGLIDQKPVVLDREFSYEGLLADLLAEGVHFVIRLNVERGVHLLHEDGARVSLTLVPGERRQLVRGLYKGKVRVNLAGEWKKGFRQPLWVMTDLDPQAALDIYRARMKIEESFKDLKSLLGLAKVMNKQQEQMEKVVALVLMAYGIGLLVGEEVRQEVYGGKSRSSIRGCLSS